MFMLGVIATALAILFLLSSMALWASNQLRHPVGVMAGLGGAARARARVAAGVVSQTGRREARRRPADALAVRPVALPRVRAPDHARARATTPRPERARPAGRADPAQGRRARAGLPRAAPRRGARRPAIELGDGDWDARRRARPRTAIRDGRRGRLPGRASPTAAGAGSPTSSSGSPTAPTRRSTPSSRGTRSRRTSSSSASTASSSRASRAASRERMHVVLGSGERETFRPEEFGAYYRRVARAARAVRRRPARRPSRGPVDHCGDLRLQAALRRALGRGRPPRAASPACGATQIEKLLAAGIATLAALGRARARRRRRRASRRRRSRSSASRPSSSSGAASTAATATSCLAARARRRLRAAARALARRPLLRHRGRPVLGRGPAGSSTSGGSSTPSARFTPLWAHDRDEERAAFEQFVDLVHARLARVPRHARLPLRAVRDTALKRLMGRYGTREDEIDDLLRREVFVDLLARRPQRPPHLAARLLAEGARGVPRLRARGGGQGRRRRRSSSSSSWLQTRRPGAAREIDEYNREDCIATLLLRDWLLELRAEAIAQFGPIPAGRCPTSRSEPDRRGSARARARSQRRAARRGRGAWPAQLLEYHRARGASRSGGGSSTGSR